MNTLYKYALLLAALAVFAVAPAGCGDTDTPAPDPAETPALTVALSGGSPNFAWDAQGRFLTITTAAPWTVDFTYPSGTAPWCSVSTPAGAGSKNLWITVATNSAPEARAATLTVTTAATRAELGLIQYGVNDALPTELVNRLELPKPDDPEWLLRYDAGDFTIEYSTARKHPKWVAWPLYKSHMGSSGRTDAWQWDPRIPAEYSPVQQDFGSNGYDRGHLCPSADRTQSTAMNRQTFMYSNMSPQAPGLNQKIWAKLEDKERDWAGGLDTLYICAGGTIATDSDIMGYTTPSAMAVPKYYFKVILRKKVPSGALDAIGFWFENRDYGTEELSSRHVKTIDEIEALTGLDFFYRLPAAEQARVEADFNPAAFGL
jgi:endonuclease G